MVDLGGERTNFNAKRRLARAVDQLIGICAGIAADGVCNDVEVLFLSTWLAENIEVSNQFPGDQVARRVRAILSDGVVSEEERTDLLETLQQISGNRFNETGAAAAEAAAVPADDVDSIHFVERRFCFTGKFAYGPRKKCQDAVMARGAIIDDDVTKQTHYLVLGAFVSPDWKHESYGRKIERAHALRGQGGGPLIITEEVWLSALS